MKKTGLFLALISLLIACEKSINITSPTILFENTSPFVFEEIIIRVEEYADIDGRRVDADYFNWSIETGSGDIIKNDFDDSSIIHWTPEETGYFIIRVKIGYDKNKSITALREIVIRESVYSLHEKLVGSWTGDAEAIFGLKWKVTLSFDSVGHYIGKAHDLSDNSYWPIGPFYYGSHGIDNYETATWWGPNMEDSDYRQTGIELSEDIPCTKFEIKEIQDNLGLGILSIGYEYELWGNPYQFSCTENFEIENLVFSDDNNGLYFTLVDVGNDYDEWYMKYNLTRTQ